MGCSGHTLHGVNRTFRGTVVAALALTLAMLAPLDADAARSSRTLPPPDDSQPDFTRREALGLLAKAQRQLRRDTQRVRERKPVGSGLSTDITLTLRDLFLARRNLTGDDRREADALLARPTDPGGDPEGGDGSPILYPATGRAHWCPTGGVACIHWVATGAERINLTDSDDDGVPDYVETVYATMSQVWSYEIGTLGYRKPLPDDGGPSDADNPDAKLDIYLADLGSRGIYGYCAPEGSPNVHQLPVYCVLDNDFAYSQFRTAPANALRVTAAHEFFHAIQFAYDVDEDYWMMEGTATWVEDEVYDAINDNYQYLDESAIRHPRGPTDYSIGFHRYGSFLFFKYASERLGRTVVRQFWENADATRNRYSLQAIRAVLAARKTSWPAFYAMFGSWNTLPARSYSERAHYPTPALTLNRTLTKRTRSTGWRKVSLPHLSNSAIRVAPGARLSPHKNLLIEANLPDTRRGAVVLVQRRFRNGTVSHAMMPLDTSGHGRLQIRFDRRVLASVVVVASNTSTAMRDCGTIGDGYGGPVYSCYGRGYYDYGQTYAVRTTLR
jgi:hypothetical protein